MDKAQRASQWLQVTLFDRPTSRRETDDTQGCVGTKRNLPKTQEPKNAESAQAQSGTGSGRVGALASV